MDNRERGTEDGKLTPAAMDTLRQVHKTFLQFLRRRLRNHGEAEEVMQQFYVRVVAHASQLRKEESAVAWLRRVLQSTLSDHRRRAAVRMRAEADFGRKDAAAPSLTEEIDDVVCKCLSRLLPLLKPEYAEVLRRVELESEARESVAADLGLSPGNLTVRLHRARKALHRALKLTCETCPVHGYFDCGCEYTKRLRPERR